MKKCLMLLLLVFSYVLCEAQPSGTVEFIVNKDVIIQNDNYDRFLNELVPYVYNNDIKSILLIGSASPEGSLKRNIELANLRANKISSYFEDYKDKIIINNDYNLFLQKTHLKEDNYSKLRATYIEIIPKKEHIDTVYIKEVTVDTIYIKDTVYCCNTIYLKPRIIPIIGIKTNMLGDLVITPNIKAEIYTYLWGLSLEFDYAFPWWHVDDPKYFYYQALSGIAGIRKYFRKDYTGHYIGLYGNTTIYDICLWNKENGWQGELYGGGLSYGYVFQNKKHPRWKFEPYIRMGWFDTRFDTYHASQPFNEKYYYNWYSRISDFVPRRFNMNYFGPTAIGVNVTFDLICIRKY